MILGFIGLGIMGESMSENLIKKSGHQVIVYDIDASKIDKMVELGALKGTSSQDVVTKADIIFSMVPKSEHMVSLIDAVVEVLTKDHIWVDMSTIDPTTSVALGNRLRALGITFVDAPVVKSKAAAVSGTLGIYVGGDKATFELIKPLLLCMGNNVILMGEQGKGIAMKIIHNMLVGQIQNGVNEMFVMAGAMGMDLSLIKEAISYGGGQNFYLDGKANAIIQGDFSTAFSVENMAKDIHIAYQLATQHQLKLEGLKHLEDVYQRALQEGIGKEDFSATFKIVKEDQHV